MLFKYIQLNALHFHSSTNLKLKIDENDSLPGTFFLSPKQLLDFSIYFFCNSFLACNLLQQIKMHQEFLVWWVFEGSLNFTTTCYWIKTFVFAIYV